MSMFSTWKPEKPADPKVAERKEPAKPVERPSASVPPASATPKPSAFGKGSNKMVPSVIGEDLTVTGNVISKGEVQVDGEVQGDVHCSSLVVGEKATITGGILAEDVIVRGRVLGSVRAQRVTLQSTSHVEGDIHHQSLAIEQGAFFEGKSRRADDPTALSLDTGAAKPPPASAGNKSDSGKDDDAGRTPRAAE